MVEQAEKQKEALVRLVMQELLKLGIPIEEYAVDEVPVSVSGRHLHLSRQDMDALFGPGSDLTMLKDISQPNQFASRERVTIEGPKGKIENLRVLGPLRKETQIELAASDARRIGVAAPVRASGELKGTPGVKITGPYGAIHISQGCIVAERHIHMTPDEAARRNVADGQEISVELDSGRGGIFGHVYIRVSDQYAYDMHIDSDEANAFGVGPESRGKLII